MALPFFLGLMKLTCQGVFFPLFVLFFSSTLAFSGIQQIFPVPTPIKEVKPWYETQILGVIIGAAIGFLLSCFLYWLTEKNKKNSLKSALKEEVKIIEMAATFNLEEMSHVEREASQGENVPIYSYRKNLNPIFKANMDKIGMLDKNVIEKLIILNSHIEVIYTYYEALDMLKGKRFIKPGEMPPDLVRLSPNIKEILGEIIKISSELKSVL